MFPFPPAIPAIPVSLASQTSLKAAMPNACMAANFCGNASRKAPRFALSPSWSAAALSLHLCGVANTPALYCSLSLSISYRIFIKFFLEVGGFSLPLLPCSLNLVCFLQISMTASTQRSVFRMCRVSHLPLIPSSVHQPAASSRQKRKRRMNMNHWKSALSLALVPAFALTLLSGCQQTAAPPGPCHCRQHMGRRRLSFGHHF